MTRVAVGEEFTQPIQVESQVCELGEDGLRDDGIFGRGRSVDVKPGDARNLAHDGGNGGRRAPACVEFQLIQVKDKCWKDLPNSFTTFPWKSMVEIRGRKLEVRDARGGQCGEKPPGEARSSQKERVNRKMLKPSLFPVANRLSMEGQRELLGKVNNP